MGRGLVEFARGIYVGRVADFSDRLPQDTIGVYPQAMRECGFVPRADVAVKLPDHIRPVFLGGLYNVVQADGSAADDVVLPYAPEFQRVETGETVMINTNVAWGLDMFAKRLAETGQDPIARLVRERIRGLT